MNQNERELEVNFDREMVQRRNHARTTCVAHRLLGPCDVFAQHPRPSAQTVRWVSHLHKTEQKSPDPVAPNWVTVSWHGTRPGDLWPKKLAAKTKCPINKKLSFMLYSNTKISLFFSKNYSIFYVLLNLLLNILDRDK